MPTASDQSNEAKWLEDKENKDKLRERMDAGSATQRRELLLDLNCAVQLCEEQVYNDRAAHQTDQAWT